MMIVSVGSHFHWPAEILAKYGLTPGSDRSVPLGLNGIDRPSVRLSEQARDGIDIDVLVHSGYPVLEGLALDQRTALVRDFNDWLAKFTSYAPNRLVGVGELPFWDPIATAAEVKRIVGLGLRGVMIPAVPGRIGPWSCPATGDYSHAAYRPVWETIVTGGIALVVHEGVPAVTNTPQKIEDMISLVTNRSDASEAAVALITAGIFRNYPELYLVCIESGIGWMADTLRWLDRIADEQPFVFPHLHGVPSKIFQEHIFGTVAWDLVRSSSDPEFDEKNLMWSGDSSGMDANQACNRETMDAVKKRLSGQGRTDILCENAVKAFGLENHISRNSLAGNGRHK